MTNRSLSVQKHRAKLKAEDCARLEVTLGAGLILQTREQARSTRRHLWQVVEDALIAYLKSDPAGGAGNAK